MGGVAVKQLRISREFVVTTGVCYRISTSSEALGS